jgi:EmrB/QacA subfamily drug resistance transporter
MSALHAACDRAYAESRKGGASGHPRLTLAATILGSSLSFIDGSVVNVALPALARDLRAGPADLPWAINAYLLPLGALILFGGALGDRYGRRRMFLAGIAFFAAASALCAVAPTLPLLLAARAVQGAGAALLLPNSLAILGSAFSGEARGRAVGTWAAVGALAGAAGPVLGGWLVDAVGWRTIFLINLPVAAGAAFLSWRYVAESREAASAGGLDWTGAALATAGLAALTWGLTVGSAGGRSPGLPLAADGFGAVLMAIFIWTEQGRGEHALMPLALFGGATFVGLTLLTFFLYGALGGLMVLLPYLLIHTEHYSAIAAGAALLPVPIVIGLASPLLGRLTARLGGRWPLTVGSAGVAAGLALLGRIDGHVDYWRDILPGTALLALGMAGCVAPLTTSVIASVDQDHVGVASGFNSAVARIAGLVATALLGFVFAEQASAASFLSGFRLAALVAAGAALASALSALLLVRTPPQRSRNVDARSAGPG